MEGLFRAIRAACSPRNWSRGVELARGNLVVCVSGAGPRGETAEAVSFRVKPPERPVAVQVVLFPADEEWDCDCGSGEDVCEHAAAAAIVLRRAREGGQELPAPSSRAAALVYLLRKQGDRLAVERCLRSADGREQPLGGSLGTLLAAGPGQVLITATQSDLNIDRVLASRRVGTLPLETIANLIPPLSEATHVRLDGEPVAVSADPLLPSATVRDEGGGLRLRLEADSGVVRVVVGGLVLCKGEPPTLRLLGATHRTGLWLERLPWERTFAPQAAAELLTELVPALQAEGIVVDIHGKAASFGSCRLTPRLTIELGEQEGMLSVLPLVVYGDPPEARVHGDKLVQLGRRMVERHEAAERRLCERLRVELDLAPGRRAQLVGPEAYHLAQRLRSWGGELYRPELLARYPAAALRPSVVVRGGGSRGEPVTLDVRFASEPEPPARGADDPQRPPVAAEASVEQVLAAWQQGASLVPLLSGGFAPLPGDWLEQHGHLLSSLLAARGETGVLARAAHATLAQLCRSLDTPPPAAVAGLAPLLDGFEAIPPAPLPEGLCATLRPYQQRGVDWLCFLRQAGLGAVLADDMGLGKTLETLCALPPKARTLVVCPTSVVHNWAAEIRRFRPDLRTASYRGPDRKLDPDADVTLTSYALLRLDAELLTAERWGAVVLDEAQAVKNPDSQVTRAAYGLQAEWRVALTGTPIENRLEELWSLAHFTNPGLLGGRSDFNDRYALPIAEGRPDAAERLRQRIRPIVLRRTKAEVAVDLPPRTEAVMHCELDEAERAVYQAVEAAAREQLVRELAGGASVLAALEALLRLRQAACHVALVPGQRATGSAKVTRLLEALDEVVADGHKALVFSQWTSLLDLVEPHLEAAHIAFARLDGSTRDREGVVAAFQDPAGPPVMLLSLKAGGVGLNLTAADHVFLLDPWWNPAVEDQAADRAHRIGQDRPVLVYRLVAKDTVEERILLLQEHKRALADVALAGASQAAGLTREDLLALLA